MKSRNVVMGILVGLIVLVLGYGQGWAKGEKGIVAAKIAVVNLDRIFENSKKSVQWQEKMRTEDSKARGEIEKMSKEIEAVRADMDTRKAGSVDFLRLAREGVEKNAVLEATKKFYQQEMSMKEQQRIEQMYQEIRVVIAKVAKEKGFDMVLAQEQPEFPVSGLNELLLEIKTSKVLYHAEEMDITNEVLAILDGSV